MVAKPKIQPGNDLPAGLSQPALRALAGAGIDSLEGLSKFREALAEKGLAFAIQEKR